MTINEREAVRKLIDAIHAADRMFDDCTQETRNAYREARSNAVEAAALSLLMQPNEKNA